jgi:hypothetical protein
MLKNSFGFAAAMNNSLHSALNQYLKEFFAAVHRKNEEKTRAGEEFQ